MDAGSRLQPHPDWLASSGEPLAFAQGLWAGGAAIVLLTFAGFAGDPGMVSAIFLTAVVPGLAIALMPLDVLVFRRASDPRLSLGLTSALLVCLAWLVVSWILPSGLPLPTTSTDEAEVALPTLLGLLLWAERFAARGRLEWRDRALGAAAGHAVVGGVFLVGVEWLSWAVLLLLLPVRLHRSARIALGVLSGAAALGLGQYVDDLWLARFVEAAAFVAYLSASLWLAYRRPSRPPATPTTGA